MDSVHVDSLDHLVLRVRDPERSLAWYRDRLGLAPEREEAWRAGEVPFVSVRIDATTVIDLLETPPDQPLHPRTGVDHIALVVDPGTDLAALAEAARASSPDGSGTGGGPFDVVGGPARLWGARGYGEGLYVRDPDGHVVELRVYPDTVTPEEAP